MVRLYVYKRHRGKCPKGMVKRCARGTRLRRPRDGRCRHGWRKRCVRSR